MIVCRNAIGQQNLSDIINKNHTCVGAVQESKNPISIQICEHDFVNEITPVILSLAVLLLKAINMSLSKKNMNEIQTLS